MRLFTALDITSEVRQALARALAALKPAAKAQWSPLENLHITTKFIGEWPETDLPRLHHALASVPRTGAIDIGLPSLGWFPNPHRPRVLFAGIDAPEALRTLAAQTDEACGSLGIPLETKPYRPHLTLARLKDTESVRALRSAVAALPQQDFGVFTATAFHLYSSVPGPGGSKYEKIGEFPLT